MDGGQALWPEYTKMINGYFKGHWNYPTQIAVKVEDPNHPLNAPFTSVNQAPTSKRSLATRSSRSLCPETRAMARPSTPMGAWPRRARSMSPG